jgi:mannose-6-phosphate isomerase-like protein (cupin superfamily)
VNFTAFDAAVTYDPPGHHGVLARRIQGREMGGPRSFTVGISGYAPGSTVDQGPTAAETVYVVLGGELEVTVAGHGPVRLGPNDSLHLDRGEVRSVRNTQPHPATLLVVLVEVDDADSPTALGRLGRD